MELTKSYKLESHWGDYIGIFEDGEGNRTWSRYRNLKTLKVFSETLYKNSRLIAHGNFTHKEISDLCSFNKNDYSTERPH